MSEKINFHIDGKLMVANKGETIWQVAKKMAQRYLIYVMRINLATEPMEIVEHAWLVLKVKEF
mgnify:CR=1 FL=1